MPDIPSIMTLPDPPIRGTDTGPVFSNKTAALLEALNPWVDDLNAFALALVAAAAAANYSANSTTSLTIGTGTHSLTIEQGKMIVPGQFAVLADAAAPTTNYMYGQVSSYNRTSGALEIEVAGGDAHGSGTKSAWFVGLSGSKGSLTDGALGDFTISGDGTIATINNGVVTNAKLANMATARIKGRTSSGTGDPEDLTPAQVTALLDTFTASLKGLVPSSGGGTSTYLRADGAWGSPSADASAWTQIGAEIVATGSGPWAFTSIPDVYSDLLLVYVVQANTSPSELRISFGDGISYNSYSIVLGNFASVNQRRGSMYVPAYNYDSGLWLFGSNTSTSPSQSGGQMLGTNSDMAGGGWTVSGGVDSIRVSVGGATLVAPSSFKLFGR